MEVLRGVRDSSQGLRTPFVSPDDSAGNWLAPALISQHVAVSDPH